MCELKIFKNTPANRCLCHRVKSINIYFLAYVSFELIFKQPQHMPSHQQTEKRKSTTITITPTTVSTRCRLGKIIYMRLHLLYFSAALRCAALLGRRFCGFLQSCIFQNIKNTTTTMTEKNINKAESNPHKRLHRDKTG